MNNQVSDTNQTSLETVSLPLLGTVSLPSVVTVTGSNDVFNMQLQQPFIFSNPSNFVFSPTVAEQQPTLLFTGEGGEAGQETITSRRCKNKRDKRKRETKEPVEPPDIDNNAIEFIEFIHTRITEIPNTLHKYSNLRTVELSHNKIKTVQFPYESKITHVFLSNNAIENVYSLPKDIICLDLNYNKIVILPNLDKYRKLTKLTINNNLLTSLTNKMPDRLQHLECSHNRISICNASSPYLKYLNISNNVMTKFTIHSIYLEFMNCSFNPYLEELPFMTLSLKYLNISHTSILLAPTQYNDSDQKIVSLPDSIEELHMNGCEVESLLKMPTHLKKLSCIDCSMHEAEHLWKLKELEYLNCSDNYLETLKVPASLCTLYCQDNELLILDIPYNTSLEYVNCSANRLKSFRCIPSKITHIKNFQFHNNELFFMRYQTHFVVGRSSMLDLLKSVVKKNNIAFTVSQIINQPQKYRHLIKNWGPIHESFEKKTQHIVATSCNECPICYTEFQKNDEKCITECEHCFCHNCIHELRKANGLNCPMCRNFLIIKPFCDKTFPNKMMMDCVTKKERRGCSFNINRPYETAPLILPRGFLFFNQNHLQERMYTYTTFLPSYASYNRNEEEEEGEYEEEQEEEDW